MRCVYLDSDGIRVAKEYPKPQPSQHEALVRISLAGICSTDLELAKGYMGFSGVLGHEFVGVVQSAAQSCWVGRRVVGEINVVGPDVASDADTRHDPQRTVIGILNHDGAMADYLVLPVSNLVSVPDAVSDEMAVFTEPLAAAMRILEQSVVDPSSRVAVVGPGRLGILIGKVLQLHGVEVTMLGRSQRSLEFARSCGLAAMQVVDAKDENYEFVVEATGNVAGLENAIRISRPKATLVMKSTYAEPPNIDLTRIVINELNVVGSRCGRLSPAMRLLENGLVDVSPLVDATYPIDDAVAAFEHAAQPGVRKILIDCNA